MLLFATLISGSFSLGGMAAPFIDPGALTAARFAIAALVLGALAVATGALRRHDLAAPWRYPVVGGLLAAYFVLMFEGLRLATPVSMAAVFTMTPLMTAGLARVIVGQRASAPVMAALLLAAVGALWVIFRADLDRLLAVDIGPGEALFLVGCFCHALFIPLVRRFSRGETGVAFTFWTVVAASLMTGVWAAPALVGTAWPALPAIVWITLFYLAIGTSAVTLFLMRYAALRLPSAKVMAYGYLIPSLVAVEEGLLGHGWIAAPVLPGVAATVAALVWLVALRDR
ncbi:hypothetical protein GCM10017083_04560 [Thalassobaculum fulvum]|jgi:drug/metabolite transporter (DMT)-like permease|uniref:EamA domain-containing protein n=2 Tax=Thalassobaculum fulvum TaxID=1633335 RepID=A0A918XNI5_9PROT|nr:hypothetical protein GCM10017083_04560 [Thalassobaculum fulvum]